MTDVVYRLQDRHGRGPWKPGFSQNWADPERNRLELPPWPVEFGLDVLRQVKPEDHVSCGCRTLDQLRAWFSPGEYLTLLGFGYRAVVLSADRILAESSVQLLFARRRPLYRGVRPVLLYAPTAPSSYEPAWCEPRTPLDRP